MQGFGRTAGDGWGCAAAISQASAAGFTVSGVWVAADDFAPVVLWQADNPFEHPRIRYLPNWDFDGVTLAFDLTVTNCLDLGSTWFPPVDCFNLSVIYKDGTTQSVDLKAAATAVGSYADATALFELMGTPTPLDYIELAWLDSQYSYQLGYGDTLAVAAAALAAIITADQANGQVSAHASGAQITLTWHGAPGANGNRIGAYGTVYGSTESWAPAANYFTGGASPATWHLSFNFSTTAQFAQSQIQEMFVVLAAPIQQGNFARCEFSAVFANWTVTDANSKRALKVAGPGSVRIEETDSWVKRAGFWDNPATALLANGSTDGWRIVSAWWSQGTAIRTAYSAYEARSLTIETHCQYTHDIYVGTYLDIDCGQVSASLDGGAPVTFDFYGSPSSVRRKLFSGVAAGQHSVVITPLSTKNSASTGWYFYFDFLECAVPGDVPDAPAVDTAFGVATDYDTDNSYKLPPERLVWAVQKLGLVGEIDHYCGVFWWMEHFSPSNVFTAWSLSFSGAPTWGSSAHYIYLHMGASVLTHLCLIGDTAATVAKCLEMKINAGTAAFWASAAGAVLTITERSHGPEYDLTVTMDVSGAPGLGCTVSHVTGSSTWLFQTDDTASVVVNRAARDWHADYFALLHAAGIGCVVSFSQELVNPPDNAPTAVWLQRYHDGTPVTTATGYSDLSSSQIAFSAPMHTFIAKAYNVMAGLMSTAGLPIRLQFGEVGWWFQAGGSPASMAFYDADTTAAAATALGRALYTFLTPNDNPNPNAYADANFLRTRLYNYVAAVQAAILAVYPTALFELLWPLDVNDPATAQLCRYINLPTQWASRAASGFDTFLVEGLSYGGIQFNLDKALACAGYPFLTLGWDLAHSRYLVSWLYPSCPWQAEYLQALNLGIPVRKGWAWDQLNLYGLMWWLVVNESSAAAF